MTIRILRELFSASRYQWMFCALRQCLSLSRNEQKRICTRLQQLSERTINANSLAPMLVTVPCKNVLSFPLHSNFANDNSKFFTTRMKTVGSGAASSSLKKFLSAVSTEQSDHGSQPKQENKTVIQTPSVAGRSRLTNAKEVYSRPRLHPEVRKLMTVEMQRRYEETAITTFHATHSKRKAAITNQLAEDSLYTHTENCS